jgi:hypothetical protein
MDRAYGRQTFDFLTGSGNHSVSSLTTGTREFVINWKVLHQDTFTRLEQYRIGANGPGPWAFIDPSAPNLLPANVAAGAGLYCNATGLIGGTPAGQGTPGANSDPTFIHRVGGYRSIRWRFLSAPVTFPTMGVQPLYRSWWATPVAPSLPYTFSSWIRPDGIVDSNISVAMVLEFLDSSGVLIGSATSSGAIAVTTWQRLSVTATSPVNAAYVRPTWVATGSTITLNGILYIDEPILEQDSVVNDWAPSSGVRPVEIVGLSEGVPFAARFRQGVTMTLRELAR